MLYSSSMRCMWRRMLNCTLFTVMFLGLYGCHISAQQSQTELNRADQEPRTQQLVFDESNWQSCGFAGDGGVVFNDEHQMRLETGYPLTAVVYAHDVKELLGETLDAYQITFSAQRDEGRDFFVGLTFPIGLDGHGTWIAGGWAGAVVGLSSINGYDASENQTTKVMRFENGRWYDFKLIVTPKAIYGWIDGQLVVRVQRDASNQFDVRVEVEQTKPLGWSAFQTTSLIQNVKVTQLNPQEIKDIQAKVMQQDNWPGRLTGSGW